MNTYIALLRGINVGGKNIIKMADLKKAFESIGLHNVQTYIQSGNILFRSDNAVESLQKAIEGKIEDTFGLSINLIIRTSAELEQLIMNCPFTEKELYEAEEAAKVECFYVAFFSRNPLSEKLEKLKPYRQESDQYHIIGRDMYLLFQHSIRESKLANNLHKLEVPVTIRNWNTIVKLAALAKEMDN